MKASYSPLLTIRRRIEPGVRQSSFSFVKLFHIICLCRLYLRNYRHCGQVVNEVLVNITSFSSLKRRASPEHVQYDGNRNGKPCIDNPKTTPVINSPHIVPAFLLYHVIG
eukprot:1392574-Amorphochlora_amoeboformis.AAC.3